MQHLAQQLQEGSRSYITSLYCHKPGLGEKTRAPQRFHALHLRLATVPHTASHGYGAHRRDACIVEGAAHHSWSTRGSSDTARSHTLRAWLMKRWRISISAYFSQTLGLVYVTSSVRSHTLRARRKSFWPSSHVAYCARQALTVRGKACIGTGACQANLRSSKLHEHINPFQSHHTSLVA